MAEGTTTEQGTQAQVTPDYQAQIDSLTLTNNTYAAKESFSKAGIPESMLEFVINTDKEKQDKAIENFTTAWNKAMKGAVTEKMKGVAPVITTPQVGVKKFTDMTYSERLALKQSNPTMYETMRKQF
jgi:hypothetical protein